MNVYEKIFLHLDCRYYRGDRPCEFKRECRGCPHYHPMGPRVLIIKLGALGDVVRTGSILQGLRQLTIEEPWVTWVTSAAAADLVRRMPGVHQVMIYGEEAINRIRVEKFDYVLSLDKEPGPTSLAMTANADIRKGIGLSRYGTPFPLTDDAHHYFELGLNDDLKFRRNTLSYQQLIFEALGMTYNGERFRIELTEGDKRAADARLRDLGADPASTRLIGFNPGAGGVFAYKAWREEGYIAAARELLADKPDHAVLLLGGDREQGVLQRIQAALPGMKVFNGGTDNTLGEFTALIDRCSVLVCGDTLAMHLAIAREVPFVAMFGPTCEQEIDTFGRGIKIKSPIECSPCYLRTCDRSPTCQDMIRESEVVAAVRQLLEVK